MRVRPRPTQRASAGVQFDDFAAGAAAVRALSQSGLYPSQLPPDRRRTRRAITGAGDGSHALLVLGFESAEHDVEPWMTLALELLQRPRRTWERRGAAAAGRAARSAAGARRSCARPTCATRSSRSASSRRRSRPRSPGIGSRQFHEAVLARATGGRPGGLRRRARSPAASPTCIPDGPAPYYTILAPRRRGRRARAVGGDQARGGGRGDRRRRHDHPPPRRRPRPSALV